MCVLASLMIVLGNELILFHYHTALCDKLLVLDGTV
jgi:hypothetical protein